MSSFLCFICHSTVNCDTNEETREKYREIVGMSLCPDSHLCYICCHMVNKLWLFKSVCLKRSLEYPVLFREKGTLNLQQNDTSTVIICSEENCMKNNTFQIYLDITSDQNGFNHFMNRDQNINSNDYMKLQLEIEEYFPKNSITSNQINIENEDNVNRIHDLDNVEHNNGQFENYDGQLDYYDGKFGNNDGKFEKSDGKFENSDGKFGNNNGKFENSDEKFDSNEIDVDKKGSSCSNDDSMLDFESNNDGEETDTKIQSGEEVNYDCYDDERNECLDEIRNEETVDGKDSPKKKSKSKKSKTKDFKKILLSFEEQKSELEAQRKSKKYLEAEFKCYNCALGFLFKDTYQAHMMRHEESNGEYLCVLCSLRFATGAVLRSHTTLHSVRYKCERCAQHIRARQTHTHAKRCHDKATEATCHLCGKVFQDTSGLQQHLRRFHKTKKSNRNYSCSVCGKNYNNQAAVRTHMIKHIHRKFNCDQCDATFSSPYTLTQHKKRHLNTDVDVHYCDTCDVTYSTKKSFLAHLRNAPLHQQRPYDCPICNRSCPNDKSLSSHISTVHSTTKDFCCQTCNARYSSRKSLLRHIRSHTNPPQVKIAFCHMCGKSFKGKSKLNRHLREVCEKNKLEEELSSYYEQQPHLI